MIAIEGMEEMVQALIRRGYTEEKAGLYASYLGDTIEVDENGKWIVRDGSGREIDRIDPIEE